MSKEAEELLAQLPAPQQAFPDGQISAASPAATLGPVQDGNSLDELCPACNAAIPVQSMAAESAVCANGHVWGTSAQSSRAPDWSPQVRVFRLRSFFLLLYIESRPISFVSSQLSQHVVALPHCCSLRQWFGHVSAAAAKRCYLRPHPPKPHEDRRRAETPAGPWTIPMIKSGTRRRPRRPALPAGEDADGRAR